MPAVCPQEWTSAHHASAFACWGKKQAACVVLGRRWYLESACKSLLIDYCTGVLPTCKFGLGGKKKIN